MAVESMALAAGPIALGILIGATVALKWPNWVHYIWAAVCVIFGVALIFV